MLVNSKGLRLAVIGVGMSAVLAGCAQNEALAELEAPEVNVSAKNVQAPQARRLVNVPFETKLKGQSVAAACTLDTPYYSASFTSPANLRLPDYGSKTPAVTVSCQNSAGSGAKKVNPASTQSRNAAAVGGALFGVLGAVVAAGASQNNEGDYFYNRIILRLE